MKATPLETPVVADLVHAAGTGDRRAFLEALRHVTAVSIVEVDPQNRAALIRQAREIAAEIEALPVKDERSQVGDLASRRSARLSASKVAG
jgi:hypothetical protein